MSAVRQDVYMLMPPVWARIALATYLSGLPHYVIRKLVNDGEVRARKAEPGKANSATVYRVRDILDWLETKAEKPPLYKLPPVKVGMAEEVVSG